MKRTMKNFHDGKTGAAITVSLTFGAEQTKITKVQKDGTVNIKLVSSSPGEKAEKDLMIFLGEIFDVNVQDMEVLAGSEEKKLISIIGITPERVDEIIRGEM